VVVAAVDVELAEQSQQTIDEQVVVVALVVVALSATGRRLPD
jgi:hypothetical protein